MNTNTNTNTNPGIHPAGRRAADRPLAARTRRALALAALLAATALPAGGCLYSHENGDFVTPFDLDFQGFAEFADATVEIQAFDKVASEWKTVATAVASSTPTEFGGQELYAWSRFNFDFTTVPDWECYWASGSVCTIPVGGASAQFRFKQSGGALTYLATFDQGGVTCVTDLVLDEGEDWINAGYQCMSDESPVVLLRWIT